MTEVVHFDPAHKPALVQPSVRVNRIPPAASLMLICTHVAQHCIQHPRCPASHCCAHMLGSHVLICTHGGQQVEAPLPTIHCSITVLHGICQLQTFAVFGVQIDMPGRMAPAARHSVACFSVRVADAVATIAAAPQLRAQQFLNLPDIFHFFHLSYHSHCAV